MACCAVLRCAVLVITLLVCSNIPEAIVSDNVQCTLVLHVTVAHPYGLQLAYPSFMHPVHHARSAPTHTKYPCTQSILHSPFPFLPPFSTPFLPPPHAILRVLMLGLDAILAPRGSCLRVTTSEINPHTMGQGEIDDRVKESIRSGLSLYVVVPA